MKIELYKHLTIIGDGIISSDWISIKIIPFDLSRLEDSNGGKIIILASILAELCFNKV